MKKIIITVIAVFAITLTSSVQVNALSCVPAYPYIGLISGQETDNPYASQDRLTQFIVKDEFYFADKNIDNISAYKEIHQQYINNAFPVDISVDNGYFSDETRRVFIPEKYVDYVNNGDIVLAARPYSVEACGGPGAISIFDKNSKKLKFTYYKNVAYDKGYSIGNQGVEINSVGNTESNTKVLFTLSNDGEFTLEKGQVKNNPDINVKSIELTSLKNKTDAGWFEGAYIGFVVLFNGESANKKCSISYYRLIRYGIWGNDVKQTQQCLNNFGYNTGYADGKYGPKTYAGIREFQRAQNIKVDGIVGPQTILFLNRF